MEIRAINLVAWLTWISVAIPSIAWEMQREQLTAPKGIAWAVSYLLFIVCYAIHERAPLASIAAQTIAALSCCAFQPSGLQPVLFVIVAGQLGRYAISFALPWIVVQTIVMGITFPKPELALVVTYFSFQLFGFLMSRIANNEAQARQELARANAELHLATELLEMNSRSAERLRIARDLHDLLGHHLAALSINLEVARHQTEGEAKAQIEKSQAITKELLSDVREVVSRLREDEPVDLASAIRSLGNVIHKPALHLEMPPDLGLRDPALAQVALRAIQEIVTNSVRHSGARNLWLTLTPTDAGLTIESRDDGCGTDDVRFGNGLRGMRERVEEARGSIEVSSMRGHGFHVLVRLPA